ncbi:MAG: AmmeMemoRadiSam system protein B [Pseudomonadota bacterium]
MAVRRPDFAGSWYPGREADCRRVIQEFAETEISLPSPGKSRVGGIVPHAGWVFSGRIACQVIKALKHGEDPDTVVIFGRHLHSGGKNYLMREGSWETPIGDLKIDQELADGLLSEFSFQVETASRHDPDNTIELQLPFIKYFFPEAGILPVGVPPAAASLRIGETLAELSGRSGRKTLFLGSTDLTHYGYNYGFVSRGVGEEAVRWVKEENDKRMVDLISLTDAEGVIKESLRNQNACCGGAVGAAIASSKKMGATRGDKVLYGTSYDIRPDSSFVGYVGIVFS